MCGLLYKPSDFILCNKDEYLESLKERYKGDFNYLVELSTLFKNMQSELEFKYRQGLKVQLSVQYYGEASTCEYLKIKYTLKDKGYGLVTKVERKLHGCENILVRVVEEFELILKDFKESCYLKNNIDVLNTRIKEIQKDIKTSFDLEFERGTGIVDISDTKLVVGLDDVRIKQLYLLPLFNTDGVMGIICQNYIDIIQDTLIACNQVYDILKIKNLFTQDLGIYTRRAVHNLIKKKYKKDIRNVRVGFGYYDNDGIMCVIKKEAVLEKGEDMDTHYYVPNEKVSKQEQKEGKNYLKVSYVLSPFDVNLLLKKKIKIQDMFLV